MNMSPVKEIDFEIDVENSKYIIRWFKGGGWDVLRYNEPWISETENIPGVKMWIALMYEVHCWRTGRGSAPSHLPLALAEDLVSRAGLPRGDDGKTPLPVPIDKVIQLIALTVTQDRAQGPIDPGPIAKIVLEGVPDWATYSRDQVHKLICRALVTAQARGARIDSKTISEDDYAEASRAGHEAFMACLKDKGLVP